MSIRWQICSALPYLILNPTNSLSTVMPAQLLDGNLLSKKIRAEIAARSAIVTAKGVRPGLAVIVVGDNPASQVYVRNKVKAFTLLRT